MTRALLVIPVALALAMAPPAPAAAHEGHKPPRLT